MDILQQVEDLGGGVVISCGAERVQGSSSSDRVDVHAEGIAFPGRLGNHLKELR